MKQTTPIDLKAEAVLDDTIHFNRLMTKNYENILLTGATGFLGVYLLHELLKTTKAKIYCLIRSNQVNRLENQMRFYAVWEEAFRHRIVPVFGDLSKPMFGVSKKQFSELSDLIDVIYHNGTNVNLIKPYAKLKLTNVLGTHEILRLAGFTRTKPVHYTSTIGIFFSQAKVKTIREADIPDFARLRNGYQQTKCIAEKLIMQARERGLPACIYRPVRIMGHSKTGIIGNLDDFLFLFIKGCLQLKKFPVVEKAGTNMVPVDYVSQAMIYLSQQRLFGKNFNLSNPVPIYWKDMFATIRSLGYPLEEMSYQAWLAQLKLVAKQTKNKLYASLVLMMSVPNNIFVEKPLFDDQNTRTGLSGSSIVYPPPLLDKKTFSIYFSYFQKKGFIPALPKEQFSPLVKLASGNNKTTPLLLLHPIAGKLNAYRDLIRCFQPEQCIYGFQAYGYGDTEPLSSIEAMSNCYIKAMRTDGGPFVLGGTSSGCIVAFDMAQKLHALGHQVELFFMDAIKPAMTIEEELEVMLWFIKTRWKLDDKSIVLNELKELNTVELINYLTPRAEEIKGFAFEPLKLDKLIRVFRTYGNAMRNYSPSVYPGRITFFCPQETWSVHKQHNCEEYWKEFAQQGMEIIKVPGNHFTINFNPNAGMIAERLKTLLSKD